MEQLNQSVKFQPRQGVVLPVLQYPHEVLAQISKPVIDDFVTDEGVQGLMNDMVATMDSLGAIGLAAIQVGVPLRILVVRGPDGTPKKVVNPTLKSVSKETVREKEGCLSFLGLFLSITRPAKCKILYFDEKGEKQEVDGEGLFGRAIQHEIDHLNGKTFIDRLAAVEKQRALEKNKIAKRRVKAAINKLSK